MGNREIKFRVWNKVMEEMFYPDWDELATRAKLSEMILMQHTGLHDKNGKEIYEGDVLKGIDTIVKDCTKQPIEWQNIPFNCWVIFADGEFKLQRKHKNHIFGIKFSTRYEIIGDIYQTPELLK